MGGRESGMGEYYDFLEEEERRSADHKGPMEPQGVRLTAVCQTCRTRYDWPEGKVGHKPDCPEAKN